MPKDNEKPVESATKAKGIAVLVIEVLVSLVLNLTASAYPDQLNWLIPYGWLAVALQITYLLLPSGTVKKWIDQPKNRLLRWCGLLCAATVLICVYWMIIAAILNKLEVTKRHRAAKFHVMGYSTGFNSHNDHQLIANVYVQNDGDDADITITSMSGIARSTNKDDELAKVIEDLRSKIPKQGDLAFRVRTHEAKWFTVDGPNLSKESKDAFVQGGYTFYFAGKISIKDVPPVEFCAFVVGSNPRSIVECPSPREKK